ncbi:MAG: glycosyltransferase family 39 protein [Ignavibacteriaceae bacterium]|nr:glycosyltransferase family 39 protein [Ignavibacteriaceae bacterium]
MENTKIPRSILTLILSVSLLNLLIYLLTTALTSYGMFRDEFYYMACANRLDIGYVDHPPFSILVLAIWKTLFGDSLFAIRMISALVSSVSVFIIGLLTVRLGGKIPAVIISTLTYMLSPIFLGMNTIYSMNTFDFLFWISSAYIFLRLIQTENKKLWIMLGVVIGLGVLNKTSMFWLSAGVLAGTIFTPLRKDLKTKYPYIAAIIALIIFSPYIIWNITHDFAHLEFMRNAATRKYGGLTPISFMLDQILILNPISILIWLPGIIFFFFNKNGKQFRALGFIWLTTFLILLINGHSKGEYIAAAYQIIFAGGAVMIEKWSSAPKQAWLKYALILPVIVSGIILVPFARPLLSPEKFLEHQSAIGLKPPSSEGHETELPQFYSDMFGWEDLAKNVSKVYQSLPDEDKIHTVVYCSNYGRAGAVEYYSKKYPLPQVVCPHNNYWYWSSDSGESNGLDESPGSTNIRTVIIIGGGIEDHFKLFERIEVAGVYKTKYAMSYENNLTIFIGRGLKVPLEEIMRSNKVFI